MLKARVIPCLDVKDGRVVKGVNFVNLRDAGDPVEAAKAYDAACTPDFSVFDAEAKAVYRGQFDAARPGNGVPVTGADLHYEGSIGIDRDLLDASGILPHEQVDVLNINTGARFETYAFEGKRGSGVMGLNGGTARHCQVGDRILVMAFGVGTLISSIAFELVDPDPTLVNHDIVVLHTPTGTCDSSQSVAWGFNEALVEVTRGEQYIVVIDGFDGDAGGFQLRVNCAPGR